MTNHAIVAMVEQEVKQTRCTTCDAEHEYKAAKIPPQRKKKDAPAALYKQVLSDVTKPEGPGAILARPNGDPRPEVPAPAAVAAPTPPPPVESPADEPVAEDAPESGQRDDHEEEGPVHRPLIRATLPRPEGQTPTRPTPEFTFRQMTRPGRFRPVNGRGPHRPHGHGQGQHGQTRAAGSRPPGGNVRGNRPPSPHGRGPSPHGPHASGRHGARGKKRSK